MLETPLRAASRVFRRCHTVGLGRHAGYPIYRAYGLVPRFVLERFALHFTDTAETERQSFNNLVYDVFPTEIDFRRYSKRWGVVQAAQVLADLQSLQKISKQEGDRALQEENTALVEALKQRYEQFYGDGNATCPVMTGALKCYRWLSNKKNGMVEVLNELSSFRGQSPLSCGVWDKTATTDGHLQTYDLFFLLSNTDFTVIDKEDFMQEAIRQDQQAIDCEDNLQDGHS